MAPPRTTGRGDTPVRWTAFTRLAAGMVVLGLAVGAVFPLFAVLLGVPSRYAGDPVFRVACLVAGLVLGAANWLLARHVVGSRLRLLAGRITEVTHTVGDPVATAQGRVPPATALALPVGAADDLGATAAAFNALLVALERERRFRSVVQATNDVLALLTPGGQISFVSDSVSDVLGWSREELLGRQAQDLLHAEDADLFTADGEPVTREQDSSQVFLVQARHRDGGWRHLEVSSSDRRGDPVIGGLLVTARDVTERLELQRRLAFQATHDELTGLPNRAALLTRGAQLLSDRVRLAVLLMDLDRFKEVNDTLGHGYGDRLLAQVGPRLQPLLREADLLARLGGDEFAVLLPEVTAQQACTTARQLRDALRAPFPVDGLALEIGASIGVAATGEEPVEIGALLRQADVAMYVAKERQSGAELYDLSTDEHDRRRRLLTELGRTS
ncbi:sensor domain-containing diguanylate cyclase [uncultured Modestobacter sp.]|uniref:sensor domain-containing diguanylate cyclase n=1 Tax=uncultured Modestobacter sp. TaxID=380048 RepID=UPI002625F52C|nr:sensor domain-containing diguanylate cyclase [uncultured Modestobacter sp.]